MTVQLLSDLPAELLLRVGEHLDTADNRSLSSVNSQFRRFLTPTLFSSIRATNRYEDVDMIKSLVNKYARHVRRLNFELYINEEDAEGEPTFTVHDTAPIIWDLLSRRAVPNASTLRITFCPLPYDFDGERWDDEGEYGVGVIYLNDKLETAETVVEMQQKYSWRALLNKTFEAIASGEGTSRLHRIEVRNLPPKATSAQQMPEWRKLLNGIEEFELHPWSGDNGAGWQSNTLEGYHDFIENLQHSYFEHLTSAKQVKLEANPSSTIGFEVRNHRPIPLGPKDLPKVEHLVLQNCFVDQALIACLNEKPGQLKSIRLIDCVSEGVDEYNQPGVRVTPWWAEVFTAIRNSQTNLEEFALEERRPPPVTDEEAFQEEDKGPFMPPDDEPNEIKALRMELASSPKRRLFAYATLDSKYGDVWSCQDVLISRFWDGKDQKEYDSLMDMVKENQKKAVNAR